MGASGTWEVQSVKSKGEEVGGREGESCVMLTGNECTGVKRGKPHHPVHREQAGGWDGGMQQLEQERGTVAAR